VEGPSSSGLKVRNGRSTDILYFFVGMGMGTGTTRTVLRVSFGFFVFPNQYSPVIKV
jgi:hypothetical protein